MGKKLKSQLESELWESYVSSGSLNRGIKAEDLLNTVEKLPSLKDVSQKDAFITLKNILNEAGYKRFNDRWRQYKRRKTTTLSTITIRAETLDRLRRLSRDSGFNEDNYDLLLEYLMDPEETLDTYKKDDDDWARNTALNIDDQQSLLRAKLRLRPSTWRRILIQLEYAFNSGWIASKYTHHKKRTDEVREEALRDFMYKVKGI
ncbi:hypothetical protein [Shewanella sp. YQ_9]|uniref:hypothetical protein n=1 Tax=Shewanella sp. YQ_9 TaxID=3367231 RepID=UPI00370AFF4B